MIYYDSQLQIIFYHRYAYKSIKMSLAAPFEEGAFQHFVILPDFEPGEIVTVKQRARSRHGAVHRLGNIHRRARHELPEEKEKDTGISRALY